MLLVKGNGCGAFVIFMPLQIEPVEGLSSRKWLLWLIYSCNSSFSSTPLCLLWWANTSSLRPFPQRERMEWLWANTERSFIFVLKTKCSDKRHSVRHINAQFCTATALAADRPSPSGENDPLLSVSLWMERELSPRQCVRDQDVVNLFKCKPVQFNYQPLIKFAATTPVLTTAVHAGWWLSGSGNWQTQSI